MEPSSALVTVLHRVKSERPVVHKASGVTVTHTHRGTYSHCRAFLPSGGEIGTYHMRTLLEHLRIMGFNTQYGWEVAND